DAFALAHPTLRRFPTGQRAWERGVEHALMLAEVEEPEERSSWVSRHTLLHNLLGTTRVDLTIRWWSGRAEFRGHAPPRRLTRWRSPRRVEERREVVALHDLCLAERGVPAQVLARVLQASPLTDLLSPARPLPRFSWTPRLGRLLGDAEIARLVVYRWL